MLLALSMWHSEWNVWPSLHIQFLTYMYFFYVIPVIVVGHIYYLPSFGKFLSLVFLSLVLQSNNGCFRQSRPSLGPMCIAMFLFLVPSSAPATTTACNSAFAASVAAWGMAYVIFCASPFFCLFAYVCFENNCWYILGVLLLIPFNVTCHSEDKTNGNFEYVFIAGLYYTALYLIDFSLYTWCQYMDIPFWNVYMKLLAHWHEIYNLLYT